MIGNMKNIVDVKVYSKPQEIFKQLLNAEFSLILQSHKNSKLIKRLGISSVNNDFYNPIQGAWKMNIPPSLLLTIVIATATIIKEKLDSQED